MEIMEMAAELGKLIKQSEQYKAYEAADKAYDNDEELIKLITEYNAQREAVETEQRKPEPNQFIMETVEKRIHELYNAIMANEVFKQYNAAQGELNKLMQDVNAEITYNVTGQRPCSHDCASCGGCH